MKSPWGVLGLEPTDNARAIKRAYAKRLKTTKPDEDPEGFQTLYESYQLALDFARSGITMSDDPEQQTETETEAETETEIEPGRESSLGQTEVPQEESEPHIRFLEELHELLGREQPFADLALWDSLFDRYPLEDLHGSQQASIGSFAQLCEFGWNNRQRLRKRGKFRDLLQKFDERFDWSDQELELMEMFPEAPAENLLRRLHYDAPVLTRQPPLQPESSGFPMWAYSILAGVFLALWLLRFMGFLD